MMEKDKGVKFGDSISIGYRENLLDILAHYLDDERVVTAFLSYLAEDTVHIRAKAAETLCTVQNDDRVIRALITVLDDRKAPSKRDAMSLSDMMSTEGPPVSERALESLKTITGKNFGSKSEDWKRWFESREEL